MSNLYILYIYMYNYVCINIDCMISIIGLQDSFCAKFPPCKSTYLIEGIDDNEIKPLGDDS